MGVALLGASRLHNSWGYRVGRLIGQSPAHRIRMSITSAIDIKNHLGTFFKKIGSCVAGLLDLCNRAGNNHFLQIGRIADTDPAQSGNTFLKNDGLQFVAEIEGLLANGFNITGDGNRGQAIAIQECGGANSGGRSGNADALQLCATVEQAVGNFFEVGRQRNTLQRCAVGKGISHQVHIGIFKIHIAQTCTASECIAANGCDIGIEDHAGQIPAVRERISIDLDQRGRERNAEHILLASERAIINVFCSLRHGVVSVFCGRIADQVGSVRREQHTIHRFVCSIARFNDKLCERCATGENRCTQARNRCRQSKARKATVNKGCVVNIGNALRQHNASELGVTAKHTAGNRCHTAGQHRTGQRIAIGEGVGANGCNTVGQRNGFQRHTFRECAELKDLQIGRQGDGFQIAQIVEAILADRHQAFRQNDLRAIGTPIEGPLAHFRDALRHNDLFNAFPVIIPRGVGEAVRRNCSGAGHGQSAGIAIQHPGNIVVDLAGCCHILHIRRDRHGIAAWNWAVSYSASRMCSVKLASVQRKYR